MSGFSEQALLSRDGAAVQSKNPRLVDQEDFDKVLPLLQGGQTRWLRDALEIASSRP
jgi:hypothetical protein